MNINSDFVRSNYFNYFSGALMAIIYFFFANAHFDNFLETSNLTILIIIFSETLAVVLFLCRSNPETVSVDPYDWLIAIMGTFSPLLFRPATDGLLPQAEVLIVLGTLLQIAGLISLNRSFALVAAKREIKTNRMYRLIRHPLYASYSVIFGGYLLVHTSLANLLVYITLMTFLCLRIFREEKHLSLDPKYQDYMQSVRYRIIPYVF